MRRPLLPLCLLLLGLASCRSDDQWTFALSRSFYTAENASAMSEAGTSMEENAGAIAGALLLTLPLALDVALLPITLPHDLVVMAR